jgi:imidazolonepropionase-like amidohydrolase
MRVNPRKRPASIGRTVLFATTWALAAGHFNAHPQRSSRLVLTHATVVDIRSGQLRKDSTIVIQGDRIAGVGAAREVAIPEGGRRIDVNGGFVIPGLWDAHVHLSYLGACSLPVFVANGVTSVRNAGARLEDIAIWSDAIRTGKLVGPRVWSAGPNIESREWMERAWTLLPASDPHWQLGPRQIIAGPQDAADSVRSLARQSIDFIKFRNLPRDTVLVVLAEARKRELPVAGHAPGGMTLIEASDAGLKSVEHAETVSLRLGSLPEDERIRTMRALARNGTLITPTLITDVAGHLTPDSTARALIEDHDGARDPRRRYVPAPTVDLWRFSLELKKKYDEPTDWAAQYAREVADMRLAHDAGVKLMAGTDAGSTPGIYAGFGVHDELHLLVKDAALSPLAALQSATLNPPAFFGQEQESGAVEVGMLAELLVLEANPLVDVQNTRRIRTVVTNGRLLSRSDLDATLNAVVKAIRSRTDCTSGLPSR